jgi:aspartate/methionine/tyrosine aminotransferase
VAIFSRRLPRSFDPNPLARLLEERRRAGAPLIDLTESNPTRVGLSPSGAEIAAALPAAVAARYDPHPAGIPAAREAVARYYADRGADVDPARIVLTSSTSEAYAHLFRLLGDPGDEFLVPRPSYPLFEPLAAMECVTLAPYPLRYEGRWGIDVACLEAAAGPRTKGVIVVSPNNPTGSFARPDEALAVEDFCAGRGLALIADEVFGDFAFEDAGPRRETFAAAPARVARGGAPQPRAGARPAAPLTFVLSGLSKVAGLPQMKLAWILVSGPDPTAGPAAARDGVPPPPAVGEAMARLEWIADAFLSVSAPVQLALPELLGARHAFQRRARERVAQNRRALSEALAARPEIEALCAEGGWSAVLRLPRTRSEEEWAAALLSRGVLVHPGHFYDFEEEAYLVVSLLPEPDVFAEGVRTLASLAT